MRDTCLLYPTLFLDHDRQKTIGFYLSGPISQWIFDKKGLYLDASISLDCLAEYSPNDVKKAKDLLESKDIELLDTIHQEIRDLMPKIISVANATCNFTSVHDIGKLTHSDFLIVTSENCFDYLSKWFRIHTSFSMS
jgi:hypothetical protein